MVYDTLCSNKISVGIPLGMCCTPFNKALVLHFIGKHLLLLELPINMHAGNVPAYLHIVYFIAPHITDRLLVLVNAPAVHLYHLVV